MPMKTRPTNQKLEHPLSQYIERYKQLDPQEVSARCGVAYDEETGLYRSGSQPPAESIVAGVCADSHRAGVLPQSLYTGEAQILIIRYLIKGRLAAYSGRFIAYREMPWAAVYDQNFQGRCIKRLAFTFGFRLEDFKRAAARLGGKPGPKGDVSADLPFLPDIIVRVAIWAGDDEFPPNSQILFSDNVSDAFSAEDAAVIGDVFISALKELSK